MVTIPKLPYGVHYIDKWPFGVSIVDADGKTVIHFPAPCESTAQRNRADHRAAKGFYIVDQAKMRDAVRQQELTVEFMVFACNNHDKRRAFIELVRDGLAHGAITAKNIINHETNKIETFSEIVGELLKNPEVI